MRRTTTLLSALFAAVLAMAACSDDKTPVTEGTDTWPDPLTGLDGYDPDDGLTGPDAGPEVVEVMDVAPDTAPVQADVATGSDDVSLPDSGAADVVGPTDLGIADAADDDAKPVGNDDDAWVTDPTIPLEDQPIRCTNNGFPALTASWNDFGDLVILEAYDADLPPFGVLGIEIYDNVMRSPGSREIFRQNYRDCKLCVRIRTGCTMGGCSDYWLAESGRLVIDSWDTHFTGYIENVEFRKVSIHPDTHVSTPVAGPGWCIHRFYFNIVAN